MLSSEGKPNMARFYGSWYLLTALILALLVCGRVISHNCLEVIQWLGLTGLGLFGVGGVQSIAYKKYKDNCNID